MIDPHFLKEIPYTFANPHLLKMALTHPSMLRTQRNSDFERLEFLGDRVLGLVVAQTIYERHIHETEGDLAKRLANLVCRETCLEVAHTLKLSDSLKASFGDLSPNSAILADAVEALIGALYLDGGLEAAAAFIRHYWQPFLERDIHPPKDAKTELQELAQRKGSGIVPHYTVLEHSGPAHAPHFTVRVSVAKLGEAIGTGNSKRQAEQMAARLLLEEKR
jgi:ribonuclease III